MAPLNTTTLGFPALENEDLLFCIIDCGFGSGVLRLCPRKKGYFPAVFMRGAAAAAGKSPKQIFQV